MGPGLPIKSTWTNTVKNNPREEDPMDTFEVPIPQTAPEQKRSKRKREITDLIEINTHKRKNIDSIWSKDKKWGIETYPMTSLHGPSRHYEYWLTRLANEVNLVKWSESVTVCISVHIYCCKLYIFLYYSFLVLQGHSSYITPKLSL